MSDTLTLGIAGLRNIGMGHGRRARSLNGVRVLAGADTDAERLQTAKKALNLQECYADAREMIDKSSVDAVILALPNHLHAPLTIQALETGIHVLVEKPIAHTSADARAMIEARDRTGKTLMVGMNQRFTPGHAALKEMIKGGKLGDIYYGKTWWRRRRVGKGLWQRGEWFLTWEHSGGGPLIDLGVHMLDRTLDLMGFPRALSVSGTCFYGLGSQVAAKLGKPYSLEDLAVGLIRFADGKTLFLEAGYFCNEEEEETKGVLLHGTKGGAHDTDAFLVGENGQLVSLKVQDPRGAARTSVEHFCNVLRGKEPLSPTAEQALQVQLMIEALYKSAKCGHEVSIA
jgi:predicted dehydrogenase